MESLSVCIISKDEEENIEKCINSIKDFSDEIIVVDTGSCDNTVKVAKNLGAQVIEIVWKDDFSYARNISIKNATKEWILILDCDERIDNKNINKIKQLISNSNCSGEDTISKKGYYLKVKNIVNGNITGDTSVFRLFKNNKKYKFKGRLHEQIVESIKEVEGNNCIGISDIEILHYGYDKNIVDINKKSRRNFEILFSYDDKEKDSYYYYVLGNEYGRINNNIDAIKNYEEAIKNLNFEEEKNFYPYLIVNLVKTLYKNKNYSKSIEMINKYISIFDDLKDLYFVKFLCDIEILELKDARESLEKYLSIKKHRENYPTTYYGSDDEIQNILDKLRLYS